MKYEFAIFDFDGTLADSFPFFVSVFNQLAEEHQFKKIDEEDIPSYRHYSASDMLKLVGLPKWKLPLVGKSFKSLMNKNSTTIPLFSGATEMLQYLAMHHVKLALVSSNNYDNVAKILGSENIKMFSHCDCGMSIFGKAARLEKLLKKSGLPKTNTIYIADQITDFEAATKAGIRFGAVAWGYGAIQALRKHNPDEIFHSIDDIKRIVNPL